MDSHARVRFKCFIFNAPLLQNKYGRWIDPLLI
nr:MAG TPA: hypothetical protein [Caudoviricetes sp.]